MSTITTIWQVYSYDVWGNAKDGFEVNDKYDLGEVAIDVTVTINNPGTQWEFESAYPTDDQIRNVFRIGDETQLDVYGDDVNIYIERRWDGCPIGQMKCVSHLSLSPIIEE